MFGSIFSINGVYYTLFYYFIFPGVFEWCLERSALSLSFSIFRAVWNSNVSRLAISRWLSFGLIKGDLGFKVLSNF